ncbi:esterase-like activity of phytase family protein [Hydrogenimonas sp.]
MIRTLLSTLLLIGPLWGAALLPWPIRPPSAPDTGALRILDAKRIVPQRDEADFSGLSDLAYDPGSGRLYAVSDNGLLYRMRIRLGSDRIEALRLERTVPLRDGKGRPLRGKRMRDAEGMAWSPEGLLIAFERRPRIVLYTQKGRMVRRVSLPKPLRKPGGYRSKNKMLEALAYHPLFGFVTAPELPKKEGETHHTIYSQKGRRWQIPLSGSLTAMAVTRRGDLLILERTFDPIFRDRTITLTLLDPASGAVTPLARLESRKGWRLENFEGLASVGDGHFLMVSDDNENPLQERVLVLFRIVEAPD